MTESVSHTERAHALLSPSAAHRWMHCPASVARAHGEPEQRSEFAQEGTAAHMLCEHVMLTGAEPRKFLGGVVWLTANQEHVRVKAAHNPEPDGDHVWEIDHEMVDGAIVYRDEIRRILAECSDDVEVVYEKRVLATHVHEHIFGTVDCLIYDRKRRKLYVIDFKYGQGIAVEVDWNPQLLIYGIGSAFVFGYNIAEIELVVVQPRADHPKGSVRRQVLHTLDLIEFETVVYEAALRTESPDATAEVGEWCRFCPALYRCEDVRNHILDALGVSLKARRRELKEHDMPDLKNWTPEDMARVMRESAVIKAFFRRIEEKAHGLAMGGAKIPGNKLVEGKSNRKWKDPEAAEKTILGLGFDRDDLYSEKFVSPAQAETLIGKKNAGVIKDFWTKPPGKLVLAPEDDPRPEAKISVGSSFGAVEDEI
jgi:hypothetical protein